MKTIEEAANEYALAQHGKGFEGWPDFDYTIDDFKSGVEFAQRWIPVEEELPKNQEIVLVKTDLDSICTAYLHGEVSGFITYGEDAFIEFGKITHWRPIEYK